MANLTLAIPQELRVKMNRFPEINWSEVARQAIAEKTRLLDRMQRLLAHSTLAAEDALTIGQQIRRGVAAKHHRA